MGAHPKIIEFYGLPGCGKTTLCNRLKEYYENSGYKVGLLTDAVKDLSWRSIIHALSFHECVFFLKFYWAFIRKNVNKNLVLSPIRRYLIYKSAKRDGEYDFLFIDHGAAQSVVRALFDAPNPLVSLKSNLVRDYYRMIPADLYINCIITMDEAFSRVKLRNRKNSGTFDQYPDAQLKRVLEGHSTIFDNTKLILLELDKNLLAIDCNTNLDRCISQIEDFLNMKFM